MGILDTLSEIARLLEKGDDLTEREKVTQGLIDDAIDSHVRNTLIGLISLSEVLERKRHFRKPIKEALDRIKKAETGDGGEADAFAYDDILNDLYGPIEKLQAMSEMMCDGAHEMDVNTTGLGGVFMDIYKEFDEIAQNYKTPINPNSPSRNEN